MSAAFLAHLASGSTTVARCWRLERRDGAVLGFTDHDRQISFGGTDYEAAGGMLGSDIGTTLGLAADDIDVDGALSSARITEADLRAGLYDGAEVTVYDVNWSDPSVRLVRGVYTLGEVERGEIAFRAELRSRVAGLGRLVGRRMIAPCDAQLGDARCGVDLEQSSFKASGAVLSASGTRVTVSGLAAFGSGFFARGRLVWDTGANAGQEAEIRAHVARTGEADLLLRASPAAAVSAGETFTVRAGCDKSWTACREKFANGARFRGFPHIPPETVPVEYAVTGDPAQDGGSRFS